MQLLYYKRTYYVLILVLCVQFFVSCNTKSRYNPDVLKEYEVGHIDDTILGTPLVTHLFIEPMGIEVMDDYLVVIENSKSDRIFSVYGIKEDSILARFGQIGNAKNEFSWAPTTCYFGRENGDLMMIVPDLQLTAKVVNLSKSIRENNSIVSRLLKHGLMTERYYWISDDNSVTSQFITSDDPRDHVYFPPKFILKEKNETREVSFYPSTISCPNYDIVSLLYNSEMRISPQKDKIVEGLLYMNMINILDVEKSATIGVIEKQTFSLEDAEKHQNDIQWLNEHINICTRSLSVSENYIMVLQDRRKMVEIVTEEVNANRLVLIFNHEGDYLKSFCIKDKVDNIAFSERYKMLFGIRQDGTVLKYDLSHLL